MLTYAGIPLSLATPKLALAIERAISPRDVLSDFQRLDWPGPTCSGWTFPGTIAHRPIKVGTLFWPSGASRWATAYFLASDSQLTAIRNQLGSVYSAKPLLLSWEDQSGSTVASVSPDMFLLPPRPLFQIDGANGLWLCTFVDDRYFWWFRDTGDVTVTSGTTTWQQLYNSVATSLGVTLTNDAISANYLTPASVLTSRYEQSPLLLDAVAYNVGQRIVRDWNTGDVFAYSPTTSATIFNNNFAGDWPVMGGGDFALNPNLPAANDLQALLPGTVRVTFPWSAAYLATAGVPNPDVYAVTQTLASLNLAVTGTQGNANVKTFHDTCQATGSFGTPTNLATLQALAKQIATDWYQYQLTPSEIKFAGIVPWEVEGLSDAIEWTYRKGEVSTRVYRPPWNDLTEELLHGPDPKPYLSATISSYSLTTSWANAGTSLTLPANSTWLLMAQLNAEIISSSSGAGDSISCRLYDGSAVAGCPVEFCDAVCDSLTFVDAASLVAVYTAGGSGATIDIQGQVNTSTGSTGSILACGSLAGGQLVGVRLS